MKFWVLVFCLSLFVMTGCGEDLQIRSYKVPKRPAVGSTEVAETTVPAQMLGLAFPNRDSAWFLKLLDDPEKVEPLAGDFRRFAASIKFDATGKPQWDLIEGWSVEFPQAVTGFEAYAKFVLNGKLAITLTRLGANTASTEEWQGYLLGNFNRWREQLGLPKQDWSQIQEQLEEFPGLSTETAKAYFVSLKGTRKVGGSGGMSGAPFLQRMQAQAASGKAGSGTATQSTDSTAQPPKSEAAVSGRLQLKYETPAQWQELPASGILLASFQLTQPEQSAKITISTSTAKLPQVLEMWMQQLGASPDGQQVDQILQSSTTGTLGQLEYHCYQVNDPTNAQSIRVAVIPLRDTENLYVKMTGDKGLVESQAAVMDQFIGGLKW